MQTNLHRVSMSPSIENRVKICDLQANKVASLSYLNHAFATQPTQTTLQGVRRRQVRGGGGEEYKHSMTSITLKVLANIPLRHSPRQQHLAGHED
jgi:hypothetical protein